MACEPLLLVFEPDNFCVFVCHLILTNVSCVYAGEPRTSNKLSPVELVPKNRWRRLSSGSREKKHHLRHCYISKPFTADAMMYHKCQAEQDCTIFPSNPRKKKEKKKCSRCVCLQSSWLSCRKEAVWTFAPKWRGWVAVVPRVVSQPSGADDFVGGLLWPWRWPQLWPLLNLAESRSSVGGQLKEVLLCRKIYLCLCATYSAAHPPTNSPTLECMAGRFSYPQFPVWFT